jgi:hypothetical protein
VLKSHKAEQARMDLQKKNTLQILPTLVAPLDKEIEKRVK